MRLHRLDISGFRAFSYPVSIDLDADVVIITGENGQGKSSIFDAIHWSIVGGISRLGADESSLISLYSSSGEARVELGLSMNSTDEMKIIRSAGEKGSRLALVVGGEMIEGSKAHNKLLEELWPTAISSTNETSSFEEAFTRSVYLQQDLVRQFIDADDEQERFNAVSELIGVGRITDLHIQLENTKKAWSTVTNQKKSELSSLSGKLSGIRQQIESLGDHTEISISELESLWDMWWVSVLAHRIEIEKPQSFTSPSAQSELDVAVRQLDANRRALTRRQEIISSLIDDVGITNCIDPNLTKSIVTELDRILISIQDKNKEIEKLTKHLSLEHSKLRKEREVKEELRTLAQIALRHLEEQCPVCTQEYDEVRTRIHLQDLIDASPSEDKTSNIVESIEKLQADLVDLRDDEAKSKAELDHANQRAREAIDKAASIKLRLEELEIAYEAGEDLTPIIEQSVENVKAAISELKKLQSEGEHLASEVAKIIDAARARELQNEGSELNSQTKLLEDEILEREKTGDLAGGILDGLRDSASDIVQSELLGMQPLLQRIYSRIDPHPTFRNLTLSTTYSYGRGRLIAQVHDPAKGYSSRTPHTILSSSQTNALAVSIFLAFNLGMPSIPIKVAILDDPFQSLDDINLLGLVDLLRRVATKRQLLISTHDVRFAELLQRKLRPLSESRRTIVIRLEGWSRSGPQVSYSEIAIDREPFKISA